MTLTETLEALEKDQRPYSQNAAVFLKHYERMRCHTDVYVIIEDQKIVCMSRSLEGFDSYLDSIWKGEKPFVAIVYSKENETDSKVA